MKIFLNTHTLVTKNKTKTKQKQPTTLPTTTTKKINKAYHIGMVNNTGAVCGCHDNHTWVALTWHGAQTFSTQFLWC